VRVGTVLELVDQKLEFSSLLSYSRGGFPMLPVRCSMTYLGGNKKPCHSVMAVASSLVALLASSCASAMI
jgi:hypothetical protein